MILGRRYPRLDLRGRKRCSFLPKEPWAEHPVRYVLGILSVSALVCLDRLNSRIDHLGGE